MGAVMPRGGAPAPQASRHIAEPRRSPAFWQAWLAAQPVAPLSPPCALPWLPATARLVVLAPHPDDEVLACGALLHGHLVRGGKALIVAVTDGEASHAGDAQWTPGRLAECRRDESLQGLRALGAAHVPVQRWGLADGAVGAGSALLQARLAALLHADDVVVTTWRRDGHPDHEACGAAAAAVCAHKGCALLEAPVWMWHWADTTHPDIPWGALRAMAVPAQAFGAKQRALQAHASQLAPRAGGAGPVLDATILQRAQWDQEYFFVNGDRPGNLDGRTLF
ncbi:MAG: PIG-L family deacetylase [Comamonadaceae bacterium]|nr:MAG: PIG-L family deacetylase [Comamonadaceae bacterium]